LNFHLLPSVLYVYQSLQGEIHLSLRRNIMANTDSNLKEAFAGESQANRKYLAFARKAEQEGYSNVARLFRTAAEAETIHALAHLAAMDGVGSTADNLRAAIAGETYESTEMYPPMLQQAIADDHRAKRMFGYALKAEAVHAKLYQMALEAVAQGNDLTQTDFYLCPVCGHIETGGLPASCPICGARAEKFLKV
jgi:rubrerythrin